MIMKTAYSLRESEDFVFCLAFEDKRRGRNFVTVLTPPQIKTILFSFSTLINHGCRLLQPIWTWHSQFEQNPLYSHLFPTHPLLIDFFGEPMDRIRE